MKARRYDIDWLRVVGTVAVFLFHCTRLFDTEGWHVKNAEHSGFLFLLMRGLLWPWLMELFFLIAGVGAWYSLGSRRPGSYLWGRVKRLLVPLYTVGLFALLPVQHYLDIVTNANYHSTFWRSLPRYFANIKPPRLTEWPETLVPVPFAGHLWFLQYLFLISLATLPLLLYLRTSNGRRLIARIAETCDCSGGIFLFAVPLAVALAGFRGLFEAQRSWADLAWYGTYFVIGYILAADHRLTRSVVRHSWVCCGLWVFGFVGGIGFLVLAVDYDPVPGRQSFSVIYLLYQAVWSVTSWSAVVFVLSLGAKYLNRDHSALTSATEAVLPFYLLHQTVILAVGFFVVRFSLTLLSKLMLVIAISFPITVALCELLVRPFNAARCLFGMKATTRPRAVLGALSGRAAP